MIAFLVLILCLALSLMVVAIRRSPLVRAVALSFNCWAEHTRFDASELS